MLANNNDDDDDHRLGDSRIGQKMEMVSVLDEILKSQRIGRVDEQCGSTTTTTTTTARADYSFVFGVSYERDGESESTGQADKAFVDLCCDHIDHLIVSGPVSASLRRLVNVSKQQLVKQLAGQLGLEYKFEERECGVGGGGGGDGDGQEAERELKVNEYASNFIDNLLNECRDLIKPPVTTVSLPPPNDQQQQEEVVKSHQTIESFADQLVEGIFSSTDFLSESDVVLQEQQQVADQQLQLLQSSFFDEAGGGSSILSSSWSADEKNYSTQLRIPDMSRRTRADTETSSTSSVSTFASANTTLPAYSSSSNATDNYVVRRHSAADVPVNNNLKRKLILLLNSMDLSARSKTKSSNKNKNRLSIDENAAKDDDDPNAAGAAANACYCFNLNYSNKSLADTPRRQLEIPDDLCATQRRHSFENPFHNQATAAVYIQRPGATTSHPHHSSRLKSSEKAPCSPVPSALLTDSNNNRPTANNTDESHLSTATPNNSQASTARPLSLAPSNEEECLSVSCSSLPTAAAAAAAATISVQKVRAAQLPYSLKQYGKLSFKGLVNPGNKNRRQHSASSNKVTPSATAYSRSSRTTAAARRTRANHIEDQFIVTLGPLGDVFVDQLADQIINEAAQTVASIASSIERTFLPGFEEQLFSQAFQEASIITQTNSKISEIVFKCSYEAQTESSTSTSTSPLDRSLDCLLTIYSTVLALSEFGLNKKLTFICSHV